MNIDISKTFQSIYDIDTWLKYNYRTILKKIYGKDHDHMINKYINNRASKKIYSFYCSLDNKNKQKLLNEFLNIYSQYTEEHLLEGFNIISWLYSSIGTYELHDMLKYDTDILENDSDYHVYKFNFSEFMCSRKYDEQLFIYNKYNNIPN
jgi:hypothetical protein